MKRLEAVLIRTVFAQFRLIFAAFFISLLATSLAWGGMVPYVIKFLIYRLTCH